MVALIIFFTQQCQGNAKIMRFTDSNHFSLVATIGTNYSKQWGLLWYKKSIRDTPNNRYFSQKRLNKYIKLAKIWPPNKLPFIIPYFL